MSRKGKNSVFLFIKRLIDLLLSLIALILFSPLFILIGILIRVGMGKPVFFQQLRAGFNGKPFKLIKFRTMRNQYDENNNLLPDEMRITPLGRFLRSLSVDELPSLINVIKGEMSLVGPRPLLIEYVKRYSPDQARRLTVKPGITGWAQINGRNELTWEEKFSYDLFYVDNWSIWLDFKIMIITLWKILIREGISHPGCATMTEFTNKSREK